MPAKVDRTLAALAAPARLSVVRLLRRRPLSAGDLADALSMSRPAMSRHLRVLRRARIVEEQSLADDARVRMYRLRRKPFTDLRAWLDEVEAFWSNQLDAFKTHAERRAAEPPPRRRRR